MELLSTGLPKTSFKKSRTKLNADHAGLSPPSDLSNLPTGSETALFQTSPNKNSSTALKTTETWAAMVDS